MIKQKFALDNTSLKNWFKKYFSDDMSWEESYDVFSCEGVPSPDIAQCFPDYLSMLNNNWSAFFYKDNTFFLGLYKEDHLEDDWGSEYTLQLFYKDTVIGCRSLSIP